METNDITKIKEAKFFGGSPVVKYGKHL